MLTKSSIVSSLVFLIMLLDKVTVNLETQNFNQNDLDELKKHINSKALTKFFDSEDVEPCAVETLKLFKSLTQQLKALLEVDHTPLELKSLSEQLSGCLTKDQCLSEASRLVKELGYQKNANVSLALELKKTDFDYTKEKAIVQTSTLIFTQRKKQLLAERNSLEDQLVQARHRIKLFGDQLIQSHDRIQFLEGQLLTAQKRVDTGLEIIRTANDDIESNTIAYDYLEAEAEVYKGKVNYYKHLSEEALALTPHRECHAMTLEDKVSQKINSNASHLDILFITAMKASDRFDVVKAKFWARPNRETQNLDDDEDPELMEALRLSTQDLGTVVQKSPAVEDPELMEVLKLSTHDVGPINSQENLEPQNLDPLKAQQDEDPDLAEALRLSMAK